MFCLCAFSSTVSIDGRMRSSRSLCWRSWAALGAYVGCLGAYVGGLGSGSGPKLVVLGPKWSVLEAIRAKSGPNPSAKAIWQADQGGKVAQTRAGRPPRMRSTAQNAKHRPGPFYAFFLVDIYIYIYIYIYIFSTLVFKKRL